MTVSESTGMVGGPIVAAVVGTLAIVFGVLGYLSLGACGNGYSLIYFGLAILLVGAAAALVGQIVPSLLFFVVFLLLVVVGLILAHGASCAI
jgi:hypothetical protein